MAKKRSLKRGWTWKLSLCVLGVALVALKPRTASDPVLPVQSGQSPSAQGTLVSGQVNPFSGTYSTSVPIEVLPARNGLQPALAVSYASTNADGLAGVGWGIPSSSITRTGPFKSAPAYGASDEFYMSLNGSGVQLLPVDAATDPATGQRAFHTRVESWSKAVAHYLFGTDATGSRVLTNQVDYWDVLSKSGEHYYFGPVAGDATSDFCLVFTDTSQPVGYQERRNEWMLRKIVDVDNNTMEYTYTQGRLVSSNPDVYSSGGSHLPAMIVYGGNDVLSGYSHFAAVKFLYEDRPDKRFSYRNGVRQDIGDRLKSVLAGAWTGEGSLTPATALRKYDLGYADPATGQSVSRTTGRSLLRQITITGQGAGLASVSKSVTFGYADYDAQPLQWETGSGPYSALPGLSFSAGGYKYGGGNTEYAVALSKGSVLLDLNGDGLPDKVDSFVHNDCAYGNTPLENVQNIFLNPGPGGSAWTQVQGPSIPGEPIAMFYVCHQFQHGTVDLGVRFADVNGDGIPDKIDSGSYPWGSSNSVYLGRKDGTGWSPHPAGTIHHVPPQILQSGTRAGAPVTPNMLPPGGPPDPSVVALRLLFTPPASTAGGRVYFFWNAFGDCNSGEGAAVAYYLEGLEGAWSHAAGDGVRYASYTSLAPGPYTFHVRATNACGKSKQVDYPLTVTGSADHIPPAVQFTQAPPDGFNDTLNFAWSGSDTSDGGGPGTPPLTFQYRLISATIALDSGTGTSASFDTTNIYGGGSLIVMAYDGAGNMTPAEWAFEGGHLAPPVMAVNVTNGAQGTLSAAENGVLYADVNGDGYADVIMSVWDSRLNTFSARVVWLFDPSRDQWVESPEFEAGIPPILVRDTDDSMVDVGWRLADMNGDGLPDWVQSYDYDPSRPVARNVIFNTGHGWAAAGAQGLGVLPGQPFTARRYVGQSGGQPMNLNRDQGAWLLDINGDGLPDKVDGFYPNDTTTACGFLDMPGGSKNVWLNGGTGFSQVAGLAPYQASPPGTVYPGYGFSEPFVTTLKAGQPKALASRDTGVRVTDLNGDGLPDFVRSYEFVLYDQNGSSLCTYTPRDVRMAKPQNAASARLDYLTEVDNPIGGKTRITYASGAGSYTRTVPDPSNPVLGDYNPVVPYVVQSVTSDAGRAEAPATYTTTYDYKHPKWDVAERQFAGFREVTVVSPDGTSTKTTYEQDFPLTGMVKTVESFEAAAPGQPGGPLFQTSSSTYDASKDGFGLWHVHKLSDRTTVSEPSQPGAPSLTTGVDYVSFDAHDNVLEVHTLGDVNDPADDKRVVTTYLNDESKWLLGYVRQVDTFAASSTNPTSSKQILYDYATSPQSQSLTKGHPTEERNWLDVDTAGGTRAAFNDYLSSATIAFNGDGTIRERKDALGVSTTFDYSGDPTHRFPTSKTVHGLHGLDLYTTTVASDAWGHPLQVTDAKQVTTRTVYDGLGRETYSFVKFSPAGVEFLTKQTKYHDEAAGRPSTQFVEQITYLPNNTTEGLHSYAKYDGLGRTYQTLTPGWQRAPGDGVYTDTLYDPYGRVDKKSRPHFASTAVQWVRYEYDLRSRAVKEHGFGKDTETIFQTPTRVTGKVTGTGDDGLPATHQKTTEADAYGRLVMVQHDAMPPVFYEYDVMGSLVAAHEGAPGGPDLVRLTYDSWGHKLTYRDFDAGTPTTLTEYFYDHTGRLVKQLETASAAPSNWRQTVLAYGGDLGQLTSRLGSDNTGAPPLSESLAYYGATRDLNAGELSQRVDASGVYDFAAFLDASFGATVRSETVARITGASVPYSFATYKDWAGRTVRSVLPTGVEADYAFDPLSGLATGVSDGAGVPFATYTDYDETHLKLWTRGNGVRTAYTHHPVTDRLTDVGSVRTADNALRQGLHYTFYGDDQVRTVQDSTPEGYSQNFTYDANMRLLSASCPAKYGTLSYGYDDSVPGGGVLASKGSFQATAGVVTNGANLLTYAPAFRHRVTDTSEGGHFEYDAWGNVAQETKTDGTQLRYTYDAWNRMVSVETWRPNPGGRGGAWDPAAEYTYDASGERVVTMKHVSPPTPSPPVYSFQHISETGYEVEGVPNSTAVKERWAITGPNGIICWKQRISAGTVFYQNVGRRGESLLASMAWEDFKRDLTTEARRHGRDLLGFAGLPSRASFSAGLTASKDLWQVVSHGARAFNYDPEAQAKAIEGTLVALAILLVALVSSRRIRRILAAQLRRGLAPSVLRRLARQGAFKGTLEGPQPLGPWNVPALRLAARFLILLFFFQGLAFFVPVSAQAQAVPCNETFYPLSDHLGSVNTLTDGTGNAVMTQHFLPFGEDFESPRPGVSTCNNSEPWPYGFTGQYHDAESGLIYAHARYYNPAIGHFMSPDSVIPNPNDTFSYDRYAYVRNNPINLTDPTGHFGILAGAIIGAVVGGIMAWINGGNIGQGMLMGAIAGAMFGVASMAAHPFVATVFVGALTGAMSSAIYGGNILQGALIGAAGAAIGYGFAKWGGPQGLNLGKFGQGVLSVMSGGVVGGLSNVAMGGDFWQGFTQGAISAGLSYAANAIAGEIKHAQTLKAMKGALARTEDEFLAGGQGDGASKQYGPGTMPVGLGAAASTVDVASPYDPEVNQREYLEFVAGRALSDKEFATALNMWKEAVHIENRVWEQAKLGKFQFLEYFLSGQSCGQYASDLQKFIETLKPQYWKPAIWWKSGWGFETFPHRYVMLQSQPGGILPPIYVDTSIGFTFGFLTQPLWTARPDPNIGRAL